MGGDELEFVKDAFDSNWIAPFGPNIDAFEQDLQAYFGIQSVAALSSGTAALHLALLILGIKQGDFVLCSTFTFSASANPIVYQGGIPVFIDSEPETWNMDSDLAEKAIRSLAENGQVPKAIILVHLYGMPAKMDRFMEISKKYNVPIIEDVAEAMGSTWNGQMLGIFGSMSVLSFNGNKIITTSGGGALMSQNSDWIEKARFLATQARDSAPHYQHSSIGYNYRMSNILAGIGRGQMRVLNARIEKRRSNFQTYFNALSHLSGVKFLMEPKGFFSNRWLTCLTIDPKLSKGISRNDVFLALQNENIESRPLWKPLHLQPVFEKFPAYLNGVSEELFDIGLCLPSGSSLSNADIQRVVSAIAYLWK